MADAAADAPQEKTGLGLKPIIFGVVLALLLGGGGFFVSYSGMLDPPVEDTEQKESKDLGPLPDVEFVPLDPLLVTLSGPGEPRYLRLGAQLEVPQGAGEDVATLMPRILDILNGYLRVLSLEDVQKSTALLTLRAHMLRRIELVVGADRVIDLLITEFVIN